MQRACVFVDGENFRHAICDLFSGEFDRRSYLPRTADWGGLFDWLVEEVTDEEGVRLRTYWYVVGALDFFPYRFPSAEGETEKLRRLLVKHEPYRRELDKMSGNRLVERMMEIVEDLRGKERTMRRRFDGWASIHNGIAARHLAIEFRPAGAICCRLFDQSLGREKAVDVKLATDLIVLREIYDVAIIVSGDQDFVPAVQVVKDSGKRIVNVAFRTRSGRLLPGGARRLNHVTDSSFEVGYEKLKSYLRIGPARVSDTGGTTEL